MTSNACLPLSTLVIESARIFSPSSTGTNALDGPDLEGTIQDLDAKRPNFGPPESEDGDDYVSVKYYVSTDLRLVS